MVPWAGVQAALRLHSPSSLSEGRPWLCAAPPMQWDVAALHNSDRETGWASVLQAGCTGERPEKMLFGGKTQLCQDLRGASRQRKQPPQRCCGRLRSGPSKKGSCD